MTIELVEHNPRLKAPVAAVLSLFEGKETRDRADVEAAAADAWSEKYSQNPGAIVDILVRNDALEESVTVDGEPYNGSLEDIQKDESISLDAEVADTLTITDGGRELAASIDPDTTVAALFEERPHYEQVFTRVPNVCAGEAGATREDVEQAVEGGGEVHSPDGQRVYPQFFMDALESAGAIVWDGAWRTTDAGRRQIA